MKSASNFHAVYKTNLLYFIQLFEKKVSKIVLLIKYNRI